MVGSKSRVVRPVATLAEAFRQEETIRLFVHKVRALAFLSVLDVFDGMSHLQAAVADLPAAAATYLGKFNEGYVGFNVQRRPGYPPSTRNVFTATLAGSPRTINLCEGWNHGIGCALAKEKPSLLEVIKNFQQDELRTHQSLIHYQRETTQARRRKTQSDAVNDRLRTVCLQSRNGDQTLPSFLTNIAVILSRVNIQDNIVI